MTDRSPSAKVLNLRDSAPAPIENDGARGTFGQPLLAPSEGTGQFDIRVVSVQPGGISADHAHAWEQANYILSGTGTIQLGDEIKPVGPDDFVYVPPNLRHVFVNTGDTDLVLLSTLGPRP
jgi:quercetin dioxygenase-like cupin family protein